MPRRSPPRPVPAGAITKLCRCGKRRVQASKLCCHQCWITVPAGLRDAYVSTRAGSPERAEAAAAINAHMKQGASAN